MVIVLIGYMASGKSTLGNELAKKINYDFIDLDDFIEDKENLAVSDIFKTKGEVYFRKSETLHLKELLNTNKNLVLSVGGGTPCYGNNMEHILEKTNVKSIYLKLSIENLSKRLQKEKDKRPLISHIETEEAMREFIGKHLFERSAFYNKAEFIINTDEKSIEDIIEDILFKLF